jgi:D-beta-D-heptose 7-phosphate kinase/D-beta-D-heptose 1-phosphate adenosyltransferase
MLKQLKMYIKLMTKNKIKKLTDLKSSVAVAKRKDEKIVFTNGCFDILHLGHIKYLEQASGLGDKLIVAVNSDASVRKLKGHKRPVFPQRDRARLVAALECVDYVTIFSAGTPLNLIKALKPDVLVKGGDWRSGNIVGKDVVESYGGKVKSCGFVKGYSTSSIIARIEAGR